MIYKDFGKTGKKISALGFGCMRLPEIEVGGKTVIDEDKALPLLKRGYELGINYFDTAYYYCHENSEIAVGKALKDVRDKVMISTKIPVFDDKVQKSSDYRKMLEKSLKKLDTDYIDFYHFWSINKEITDEKIIKLDLLREAQKAKEEGLIKHISISVHDSAENIKYVIDKIGIAETMLIQYNLLDQSGEDAINHAASKGMGVVAMGPVGGGRLAAPTKLYTKLTGKEPIATYELALRFVLGNKNISCALSGMQTIEMVEQNAKIASIENPMTEKEHEQIKLAMNEIKKFSELYCTGCNYCQPCPKEIVIPRIFGAYTYHNVYELSNVAKNDYGDYRKNGGKGYEDCIDCGACEEKCPQSLNIRDELKRVENILRSL